MTCCMRPSLPLPAGFLPQLRGRLAAEARACFSDLPDSLPREAARGVPADGTVHPLCASTVSLLKRTLGHGSALRVLLAGAEGGASRVWWDFLAGRLAGVGRLRMLAQLCGRRHCKDDIFADAAACLLVSSAPALLRALQLAAQAMLRDLAWLPRLACWRRCRRLLAASLTPCSPVRPGAWAARHLPGMPPRFCWLRNAILTSFDVLSACVSRPAALDAKARASCKSRALAALHHMNNLVRSPLVPCKSGAMHVCLGS